MEREAMNKERFKIIFAVNLLLRRGNKILLLRRANTGYQDGNYNLIAGHVDGDELATSAMVREAYEEAGIIIDAKDLKFVHIAHRLMRNDPGQERIGLFFEAQKWDGEITNLEPEKCDDLSWHSIDDLPDNVIPFLRIVLRDIENGISYSEFTEDSSSHATG
jgi:8-oxo-dGTP pyrophosphatase MutT (NUDIX family)